MTVKEYILGELRKVEATSLVPGRSIKTALWAFFTWGMIAALFVGATHWLAQFRSTAYLSAAISEGLGPHLWNVLGTFGIGFFGALVIAPRVRFLAVLASEAFANTYVVGALTLGILVGQIAYLFYSAPPPPPVYWLYIVAFPVLLAALAVLNVLTWYLSYLSDPTRLATGFPAQLAKIDPRLRVPTGLALILLPLVYSVC